MMINQLVIGYLHGKLTHACTREMADEQLN